MPMSGEIELYVDIIGNKLVKSTDNSDEFQFSSIFQGSTLQLRVFPVRPTNRSIAPFYSKEDISNLTLRIVVGPRSGAEDIKAAQYTWSKNLTDHYFYGDLELNTVEMEAAILAAGDTYTTYLEIQLGNAGVYRTVAQKQITITSTVKDPSSAPTPVPGAPAALSLADALAIFILKRGNAGDTITLVSPDGTRERILGVTNDGAAQDDSI